MPSWYRFYNETIADRKFKHICRELDESKAFVLGTWAILMSLANMNDGEDRGSLVVIPGRPYTLNDLADEMDIAPDLAARVIQVFMDYNMIHLEGDTYWLSNFRKRQYESDDSTKRVQAWRERKRQEDADETPDDTAGDGDGNDDDCGDVTPVTRYSNANVTPPETETEQKQKHSRDKAEAEAPAQRRRGPPTPAAAALTDEQELALEQLLTVPGMDPATARKLVPRFDLSAVPGWVAEGRRAPPEFAAPLVISRLRDGAPPPMARDGPNEGEWQRFVSGEYAEYVQT